MFGSQVSMGLSGYFYNRIYNEYTDQRLGGRVALGYQFSPALSGSIAYRGAKINITNPIDPFLPDLMEVTGRDLALHGFQLALSLDKRNSAFLATEGYYIQASAEEVLGSFQYPRAEIDARKYFTLYQRPDGSGRQVFSLSARAGWTGDNTPIYDRFYAGGFSSIRGFQFRGASPIEIGPSTGLPIFVGGDFQMLASAEYMFPITADDMVRGVVFCDTGTVEPTVSDWTNKYRVARASGCGSSCPRWAPPRSPSICIPGLLATRRPQRDVQLLRRLRTVIRIAEQSARLNVGWNSKSVPKTWTDLEIRPTCRANGVPSQRLSGPLASPSDITAHTTRSSSPSNARPAGEPTRAGRWLV